jgi:NAD(P)-dependent dehydrogenase (short-subunit alcohol dehydrogenase family)
MKLFAQEGAYVFGIGRTGESLDETLDFVSRAGGVGRVLVADLCEEAAAEASIHSVVAEFGRVDVLINSAGVGYSWAAKSPDSMNDVLHTSLEKWHEVIAMNLDTCYLMTKAVLPHMIDNGGGSIVNIASISGLFGLPTAHAYTAAKAGVINLTRSLCVTYASKNIRVNCVAPGLIDTPMVAPVINLFDDPQTAEQLAPMARPGQPEEIAHGCLFLASGEASYCNGSLLVIDGGLTARQ